MKTIEKPLSKKLITLDYGVLAVLSHGKYSGYDVTKHMKFIWNTSHSRVYPSLAKLEALELVSHESIEQTNKPDKKVYSITKKGISILKEWAMAATAKKARKDEALLKFFCIHLLSKSYLQKLLSERIKKIDIERSKIEEMWFSIMEKESAGQNNVLKLMYESIMIFSDFEKTWCLYIADIYEKGFPDMPNVFYDFLRDYLLKNRDVKI